MEALVVAIIALVALVLIDAGYWIAMNLVRWSPVIIVGATAGWLAVRAGVAPGEALITGVLASMVARHLSWRAEGS